MLNHDYADYAQRLTAAMEQAARPKSHRANLSSPLPPPPRRPPASNATPNRPSDYPANVIETAVDAAIMDTPTPSATAPAAPLERLMQP